MNIEELSPHMGPAGRLDDPSTGEQLVEPGIAISVDDAAEVLQVRARVLALGVRRVEEQRRWRAGNRRTAAGRERRSITVRSWSCRYRAPIPAPACRRH